MTTHPTKGPENVHTHTSALTAIQVFLMVVIIGTLWRLSAAALVTRQGLQAEVGKAMAAQF